jgi:hypothetical protein
MTTNFKFPYELANSINIENGHKFSQEELVSLVEVFQSLGSDKQITRAAEAFKTLSRVELCERIQKISALCKILARSRLRSRPNDLPSVSNE